MCEIRFTSTGVFVENPSLVCKKLIYMLFFVPNDDLESSYADGKFIRSWNGTV